ncbi:MAG: nitroreductase family protein, partial [Gammaproteobacteria bacterium]|nr:nitroreductase family protein [Gammaproteobacteria bacterium]
MQNRRSVRDFSDRPVPKRLIENCLLTANSAPSG